MNNKVVSLVTHKPDKEVIEELESLLEHAKSGEVQGFSISIVCSDRSLGTFFTQSIKQELFASIGSVSYLKQRLLDAVEDE